MSKRKEIRDKDAFNLFVWYRPMMYRGLKFIPSIMQGVPVFLVYHDNGDGTAEEIQVSLKEVKNKFSNKIYNFTIAKTYHRKNTENNSNYTYYLADPADRWQYAPENKKIDHEFSGEAALNATLNNLDELKGCVYYRKDLVSTFAEENKHYEKTNGEIIDGGIFDALLCIFEEMYENKTCISEHTNFKFFYVPSPNPLIGDYWVFTSKMPSGSNYLSIIPNYYVRETSSEEADNENSKEINRTRFQYNVGENLIKIGSYEPDNMVYEGFENTTMMRLVALFIDNPYIGIKPKYYNSIKEAKEELFDSVQRAIVLIRDYRNMEESYAEKYERIRNEWDVNDIVAEYIAYIICAYSDDAKAYAAFDTNSLIEYKRINSVKFGLTDEHFIPVNLLINVTPYKYYHIRGIDKDFILAYSLGLRKVFLHPCTSIDTECGDLSIVNPSPRMIETFMKNNNYKQLIDRIEKKTLLQFYTSGEDLFKNGETEFTLIRKCTLLDQMKLLDTADIPYYLEAFETGIKLFIMNDEGVINDFMSFDAKGEILTLK